MSKPTKLVFQTYERAEVGDYPQMQRGAWLDAGENGRSIGYKPEKSGSDRRKYK